MLGDEFAKLLLVCSVFETAKVQLRKLLLLVFVKVGLCPEENAEDFERDPRQQFWQQDYKAILTTADFGSRVVQIVDDGH